MVAYNGVVWKLIVSSTQPQPNGTCPVRRFFSVLFPKITSPGYELVRK